MCFFSFKLQIHIYPVQDKIMSVVTKTVYLLDLTVPHTQFKNYLFEIEAE